VSFITYIATSLQRKDKKSTTMIRRPGLEGFLSTLTSQSRPPWRSVTTRVACAMLGVPHQSLANWRLRGLGPKSRRAPRGGGNKVLYRPDEVASWLSEGRLEPWEVSAAWLVSKGLLTGEASRSRFEAIASNLEFIGLFDEIVPMERWDRGVDGWS